MKFFCILLILSKFAYALEYHNNQDCHEIDKIKDVQPWPKNKLKVCWRSCLGAACEAKWTKHLLEPRENIKIIKEIINKEFRTKRTGVKFYGWNACETNIENWRDESSDVQLVIQAMRNLTGGGTDITGDAGFVGYSSSRFDKKLLKIFIEFDHKNNWGHGKINFESYLKMISLHEFGHVAGLHHEDDNHTAIKNGQDNYYTNDYDKNSIMSYSTTFGIAKKGLKFIQNKDNRLLGSDKFNSKITDIDSNMEFVQFSVRFGEGDVKALQCLYKKSNL